MSLSQKEQPKPKKQAVMDQVGTEEQGKAPAKKGEAWKPKEKFDKKAAKEKQKVDQEQSTTIPIQEQIKSEQDNDKVEVIKIQREQPRDSQKSVRFKDEILIVSQSKSGFVSHLKSYQQHTTQSISLQSGLNQQLMHPTLIQICLSYQNGNCMGSTYRCVEFLRGLKAIIMDFRTPKAPSNFVRALYDQFNGVYYLLGEFRSVNEGMKTAYSYLINIIQKLIILNLKTEEQQLKVWLCQQIDQFVNQKIVIASDLIIENVDASPLIRNNINILVYARSYLVENFLIYQHKLGKRINVFVVDNPPFHEGKKMFKSLELEGLTCSYILLSHVSYIIKKVLNYYFHMIDKVFVGANSMLSNGALISRVGTAFLACMASVHKVPFHVFCESYKFSEDCQIDSLSKNELQIQSQEIQKYKQIGLMYDVTPSQQINMVITEIGLIPPTSVKVIIQEFQKYNYVDKVELPR